MFSPIYLRLAGNVPPPPKDWHFFKHEYYRISFSIAPMFSPIYLRLEGNVRLASTFYQSTPPPTFLAYIHLYFLEYTEQKTCFSNSAGIFGQHDIVVLMYPPPPKNHKRIFLSEVRLELTNVPPPPNQKRILLSEVRFELTNVPPPQEK